MASSVVTVGGKGSTLSPLSVYSISNALSRVKIDSSALDKLSSQSKKPSSISPPPKTLPPTNPNFLTTEESRAALIVLLNKLILSDSDIRPVLPTLIEETLNLDHGHETLDFSSTFQLLDSLCRLNGKRLDEIGVTSDEIGVIEGSFAASTGICAILDCCASALVRLSDAVAALSCEAGRVDVKVFNLPVSGDGFSIKDETNVAGDMKVLLAESKLADKVDSVLFAEIPTLNASFREAVRSLHSRVRVELNSVVKAKKTVGVGSKGKEKAFVASVLPLAMAIQSMSECSLGRARLAIESLSDQELKARVLENFEKRSPNIDKLKESFQVITEKASSGSDYVKGLHSVYDTLINFREILAWEAVVALFVLDTDESIEKVQVGPSASILESGENSKGEKKSEKKKKKKKTLGKGTSLIRQLLKDRFMGKNEASIEDVAVLVEWVKELLLYFDPKDSGLDSLLNKVKEIVENNDSRRLPKIPKGTRDFAKEKMAIRERAFSIIVNVFKMHGAVGLDTPVFELRETLMGKYGEDSKLIYDLADQGGELCSLRYDLTVPFARYLAMNNISALKRYQIAKVYRRDNPSKGRFREFYQCDFDIAGQYEIMEPDFEVIKVLTELLNDLNIGDFEIKLNHRQLLDAMLEICGVPSEKFRTVCSSIDKLDKQSLEEIKKELVDEKGLTVEIAERIGMFVKKRGSPLELLSELRSKDSQLLDNAGSVIALNELEILFKALEKSRCIDKVVFDLSLARGLDYYTGVIFEAVFKGSTQVGSIAAGGRYDNLVGMFSGKQVPAVGVSLGIERVFAIMEQLENDKHEATRATETQVLVAILSKDLALAAELVSELWDAKIKAEFGLTKRVMNHINRAKQAGIPWMVIVGESEISSGIVKLKNIEVNQEDSVPREEMVNELKRRLNI
ncbi:histidine--tRNA ligase, cytoplasmic-like isoform X2 [Asparagus officinalis]|uniref:histidine--tRNA ligase, cytoplasmic-like isoform X1 n=1 Tax=Asparagus officinalis TaxID=4686 RepID=UPI00098E4E1E|nr:histidine--tRNA ligase, cytoplasmic-like isoform X1 [Asparagus officinalis]XP_020244999.1 histidine--tRNA ligase, cytoplasmic-like isoform X2 [Asparagus officinalis]